MFAGVQQDVRHRPCCRKSRWGPARQDPTGQAFGLGAGLAAEVVADVATIFADVAPVLMELPAVLPDLAPRHVRQLDDEAALAADRVVVMPALQRVPFPGDPLEALQGRALVSGVAPIPVKILTILVKVVPIVRHGARAIPGIVGGHLAPVAMDFLTVVLDLGTGARQLGARLGDLGADVVGDLAIDSRQRLAIPPGSGAVEIGETPLHAREVAPIVGKGPLILVELSLVVTELVGIMAELTLVMCALSRRGEGKECAQRKCRHGKKSHGISVVG